MSAAATTSRPPCQMTRPYTWLLNHQPCGLSKFHGLNIGLKKEHDTQGRTETAPGCTASLVCSRRQVR